MRYAAKSAMCTIMAIAMLTTLSACGPGQKGKVVQIKGSDTMLHLVNAWAEAYMKQHPDVTVTVAGGGSGVGIAALLNGTTDMCMASRDMRDSEMEQAKSKGINPEMVNVALDGISVIVNPANSVDTLTKEQLKRIFTGAYTNWNQVGGPDQPIFVLSRESSSGTFAFFMEHIMDKQDYSQKARFLPSTAAIVESVSQDKWSVGYVGLGYAEGAGKSVKELAIKASDSAPAVKPSPETVRTKEYFIARPLHFYVPANASETAHDFVKFCLSPEGQKIVSKIKYVPVK